ncbi:hypothetical protein AB0A73_12355 [Glycomyces sp. NPDC047369]
MAPTRLRALRLPVQEPDVGLVPDRMELVGEWETPEDETLELYGDTYAGDAHLLLVADRTPEEHVATLFHASGVVRAIVWHGTGAERPEAWRDEQRRKAVAFLAAEHARAPGAAA